MFRELSADEIEVRVSHASTAGADLLLYKTARTDMDILDETVGPARWQSDYKEQNGTLFCGIGIDIDGKWVWKWNAGAPSNIESQKGEASDAMKRAGFCWGIGRELYTAPRIFVYADKLGKLRQGKNGKMQCYDEFHVEKIRIENGVITGVSIMDDTTGHRCFAWADE